MTGNPLATTKLSRLANILNGMESAVIAYSGGVDSTFLLKAATLSGMRVMAVTGVSHTMPEQDLRDAKEMAALMNVRHMIIETCELENEDFSKNPPDRCFFCKDELFGKLKAIGETEGYKFVLDGSNLDDLDDYRPGRKAASDHGIRSPLIEAGLTKDDIRRLSFGLDLRTWNKPSSPCLSSRFPYGETITIEALKQVEEAEEFLRSLGFKELRVRHHKDIARIEIREEDIRRMLEPEMRKTISEKLKAIGYRFIALDIEGFRSGSFNE